MRRAAASTFLLVLPLACAPETATPAGEEGTQESSGGDTTTGFTTAMTVADTGDSSSGGVPEGPVAARGISLTTIEVNQGVAINVYADGDWVDGGGRNAEIVKNRMAVFRGFWEIEADFEPREILAQLDLTFEDGSTETANITTLVEGVSEAYSTEKTFTIYVPAEMMVPGLKFQMSLFEADPQFASLPEPATPPVYPATPQWVGIETTPMELRVMLVPIDHDIGPDCPEPPVLDEFALDIFHKELFQHNPVELVELQAHDLYTWTEPLTSFGGILGALADLHSTDGTDPGLYYYGVVRPCDGGPEGVGGQAIDIPDFPSMGNGWSRTAVGRWYSGQLSQTAGTFVHEIGHTQGRRHVYCNGEEGGPDPSYPYEAGAIGTWGFGVIDFSLHNGETSKDYMTYCGNTWVSDWGWHKVFPYVQEITSWDAMGGPDGGADSELLVGLIDPSTGTESWIVTRGEVGGRASGPGERIEIAAADGTVHELPVTLGMMGENGGYNVVAELPSGMDVAHATSIARVNAAGRKPIERVRAYGNELVLAP